MQIAVLDLIRTAARYQPWRGVPFQAYVRRRIRGAILESEGKMKDWVRDELRGFVTRDHCQVLHQVEEWVLKRAKSTLLHFLAPSGGL